MATLLPHGSNPSLSIVFSAIAIMSRLDDGSPGPTPPGPTPPSPGPTPPSPGPSPSTSTCSNGFAGVQGSVDGPYRTACCPLTCINRITGQPECGGFECGKREGGARNCCVQGVNKFQEDCSSAESAPCKNSEWFTQSDVDVFLSHGRPGEMSHEGNPSS